MKKKLLFVGLMLAISVGASAQYKGFSFGVKVGPGFDWTGSTTGVAVNNGVRVGLGVGLVAEYYFADNYALLTGVNVNLNRGHYSFNQGCIDPNTEAPDFYNVDRLYKSTVYEIPVMLKMITNQFGSFPMRYYAQVGAGLGYAARKVQVKDAIGDGAMAADYTTANKEYSSFRASLKLGLGAEYSIDESLRVFAGVYYSHDFINNINYISPDYCGNYIENGKIIGARPDDKKLSLLQNRVGIEIGILF